MNISDKFNERSYPYDVSLVLELEKIITGANTHKIRSELQKYMSTIVRLEKKRFSKNYTKQKLITKKNECEEKLRTMLLIYKN